MLLDSLKCMMAKLKKVYIIMYIQILSLITYELIRRQSVRLIEMHLCFVYFPLPSERSINDLIYFHAAVIEPTDNGDAEAEPIPKKVAARKPQTSKKRKQESSSEDEDDKDFDSDDSDAENGKTSGRGKGKSAAAKKGRGRGRGRPSSETTAAGGRGSGRRGRPKKS